MIPLRKFYFLFFLDDLHLQIIESISPKASVENSSAQRAICFIIQIVCVLCIYLFHPYNIGPLNIVLLQVISSYMKQMEE